MKGKIVIIGGGASGMMAAVTAARRGANVVILEQNPRLGKKILSTGNGKCNFTNKNQDMEFYHSDMPKAAEKVLKQFPLDETLSFFKELGVLPLERRGCCYPNSETASAVLDALRFEVERQGISVFCETKVTRVKPEKGGFQVCYRQAEAAEKSIFGEKLILAAGSKASSVSGSDGSGYQLAGALGHKIIKPLPALVQLCCQEAFFKELAGVRLQAGVFLYRKKRNAGENKLSAAEKAGGEAELLASDRGEVQLTNYGVSGIPILQISRFASKALEEKESLFLLLDLLPDMEEAEVIKLLRQRLHRLLKEEAAERLLLGIFHKKVAGVLLKRCKIAPGAPSGEIKEEALKILAGQIKAFKTEIRATNGFAHAQVCCGGIDLQEVKAETLESRLIPGLYFAGECLDVDGACGGYNLQWAWASGFVAGRSSAE